MVTLPPVQVLLKWRERGTPDRTVSIVAVVPLLVVVPEALLEQIERLAEQRHTVPELDEPEVQVSPSVDRQPGGDVHASARTGVDARRVAGRHRPARRTGEREIELGGGV